MHQGLDTPSGYLAYDYELLLELKSITPWRQKDPKQRGFRGSLQAYRLGAYSLGAYSLGAYSLGAYNLGAYSLWKYRFWVSGSTH